MCTNFLARGYQGLHVKKKASKQNKFIIQNTCLAMAAIMRSTGGSSWLARSFSLSTATSEFLTLYNHCQLPPFFMINLLLEYNRCTVLASHERCGLLPDHKDILRESFMEGWGIHLLIFVIDPVSILSCTRPVSESGHGHNNDLPEIFVSMLSCMTESLNGFFLSYNNSYTTWSSFRI